MLSESYFSFAPFTTFATNAFNIRDNYCRPQKNVVTLQCDSDKRLKAKGKRLKTKVKRQRLAVTKQIRSKAVVNPL